jgi:hypothetical protein
MSTSHRRFGTKMHLDRGIREIKIIAASGPIELKACARIRGNQRHQLDEDSKHFLKNKR